MQSHGWQYVEKVTVPAAGSIAVTLPPNRPTLAWMTVWAVSGSRSVTNMTFQPQINGKSFGAPTAVVGGVVMDKILSPGADTHTWPTGKRNPVDDSRLPDRFELSVNITSVGAPAPEPVTIYFAATGHDGASP